MVTPKITVENLSHAFDIDGRSVPVLSDVSLDVTAGEFLAIVGPSGCGKSTLLNVVSGLFAPLAGRVAIDGAPVRASTHFTEGIAAFREKRPPRYE